MDNLNWKLILSLSASGIVYCLCTILGWIYGSEYWFAFATLAGVGMLAAWLSPGTPKRHAFAAGFLTVFLAIWTQILFFDSYMENNPGYATAKIPFDLDALVYTVLFSPLGGLVGGILAGLASLLVIYVSRKTGNRGSNEK